MRRSYLLLMAMLVGCADAATSQAAKPDTPVAPIQVAPSDWPWWRGPERSGIAAADQNPPLEWNVEKDVEKNVLWKVPVPGRGHGSATVVGDQVFLATAEVDRQVQSVLCFDRNSGKKLWQAEVHQDGLEVKGNGKATLASSTVACDGERLFINFLNSGSVYTTALSRDGEKLWQTEITRYQVHQGYGSSPAVHENLVLVSADNKAGGAIAALHRGTGEILWKHERPSTPNYTSPILLTTAGKPQLLFSGCNLVSSFSPLTGETLWEVGGATTECVTSIVTDGQLVFTSGGYPRNHISAVKADGSGEVAWENKVRVYVPSMLVRDGYLYAVTDAGVAMCWKSATGEEIWKGRLGGNFSSSPILVGDRIYATNEAGTTYVFSASPEEFELLGKNEIRGEVFATPSICGSRIYLRVAEQIDGQRQEMLYCIGQGS